MSDQSEDFVDLLRRIRSGETDAAEQLVRKYEPEIRLKVRTWIRQRDPELRRVFDSIDICQSVMANFFLRVAAGQFDLNETDQIVGLLVVMARNKLGERVRHERAQKRDMRRNKPIADNEIASSRADSPSRVIAGRELLQEFRTRLAPDERRIADMRERGADWQSIAVAIGGTAEARRKQWSRVVDRVAEDIGLANDSIELAG